MRPKQINNNKKSTQNKISDILPHKSMKNNGIAQAQKHTATKLNSNTHLYYLNKTHSNPHVIHTGL